ncbi:recombinase [Streptomyces sp. NPDC056004]|uniref:recombinase n=1 Tax=unclassified Streptomyces TaxID=2593676 RepID=UPI0035D7EED7
MLHINSKMLSCPGELEVDLLARLRRAQEENQLGEVEGINLTLTFLRAKREETRRRARRPAVGLGIPWARSARNHPRKDYP